MAVQCDVTTFNHVLIAMATEMLSWAATVSKKKKRQVSLTADSIILLPKTILPFSTLGFNGKKSQNQVQSSPFNVVN